jgi:hypothetical protein
MHLTIARKGNPHYVEQGPAVLRANLQNAKSLHVLKTLLEENGSSIVKVAVHPCAVPSNDVRSFNSVLSQVKGTVPLDLAKVVESENNLAFLFSGKRGLDGWFFIMESRDSLDMTRQVFESMGLLFRPRPGSVIYSGDGFVLPQRKKQAGAFSRLEKMISGRAAAIIFIAGKLADGCIANFGKDARRIADEAGKSGLLIAMNGMVAKSKEDLV